MNIKCKGCIYSQVRSGQPLPDRECWYCGRTDLHLYRSKLEKLRDFFKSIINEDYKLKDRWMSPKTWKKRFTR